MIRKKDVAVAAELSLSMEALSKEHLMTAKNPNEHRAADRENQQRKVSSNEAEQARAKRDQPADLVNRVIMKRQGKNVHKQGGK